MVCECQKVSPLLFHVLSPVSNEMYPQPDDVHSERCHQLQTRGRGGEIQKLFLDNETPIVKISDLKVQNTNR